VYLYGVGELNILIMGEVKSYKRRTKSGKVVVVRQHSRKKKKVKRPIGSGTMGPDPKKK
jgi:hypothetical protein